MKIDLAAKWATEKILKEGLSDIFPEPCKVGSLKNKAFREMVKMMW